jgi:hypothetical protein
MEMSMKSRKELSTAIARRYRKAGRKVKGRILDEFVAATGYCGAYAAMLLRNCRRERHVSAGADSVTIVPVKAGRKAGGRPTVYGPEVRAAVEQLWKLFGHVCGKRLVPIIRSSLPFIDEHPNLKISKRTCQALKEISAATVDRLLVAARKRLFLKGIPHTRPASGLASQIPVRTFSEWHDVGPGYLQLDLVGHDGGISSGEFCFTLSATDVCVGWTERRAILTRAARWVTAALEEIRAVMPFSIIEIHPRQRERVHQPQSDSLLRRERHPHDTHPCRPQERQLLRRTEELRHRTEAHPHRSSRLTRAQDPRRTPCSRRQTARSR